MKIVLKFKSGTKLLFFEDVRNLRFDPIPDCSTDIFAGFPHRHTGKQNSDDNTTQQDLDIDTQKMG